MNKQQIIKYTSVLVLASTFKHVYAESLISFQPNTPAKSAEVNQNFKTLLTEINTLKKINAEHTKQIKLLQNKLANVKVSTVAGRPTIIFDSVNVQIVNGTGSTEGEPNATGNLIIGYNENSTTEVCSDSNAKSASDCTGVWGANQRNGSHNIILGEKHNYTSYAGLVAGYSNNLLSRNSSIIGGTSNYVASYYSTVTGGSSNITTGISSSISGGRENIAQGYFSSVSGGAQNSANGSSSSITGGLRNRTVYGNSSVSGGQENIAEGYHSSVSGGRNNKAIGDSASITAGRSNIANGAYSSITGGGGDGEATGGGSHTAVGNQANGMYSTITGGASNEINNKGQWSSISGGVKGKVYGPTSHINGGLENFVKGEFNSISGGVQTRLKGFGSWKAGITGKGGYYYSY